MVTGWPDVRLTPYMGAVVLYVDLEEKEVKINRQLYWWEWSEIVGKTDGFWCSILAETWWRPSNDTASGILPTSSAQQSALSSLPISLEQPLLGDARREG